MAFLSFLLQPANTALGIFVTSFSYFKAGNFHSRLELPRNALSLKTKSRFSHSSSIVPFILNPTFEKNPCHGSVVFNLSYNIQVYCVRRSRTVLSFSHKPVIVFDPVTCIRLTFILQLLSKLWTLVRCSL